MAPVHPFDLFGFLRDVDSANQGLGTKDLPQKKAHSRRFREFALVATSILVLLTGIFLFVISHAGPILRDRVTKTLSDRFQSKVELAGFHVAISNGLQISGEGLQIYGKGDPNIHQPGIQALISIAEFRFSTGFWNLLHTPTHI